LVRRDWRARLRSDLRVGGVVLCALQAVNVQHRCADGLCPIPRQDIPDLPAREFPEELARDDAIGGGRL
jgi:hypothetical protein